MMGGGWAIQSDNPFIGGAVRGSSLSITYLKEGEPSYCYRLWCFDYRDTDLF